MNRLFPTLSANALLYLTAILPCSAQEISHKVDFSSGDAAWSVSIQPDDLTGQLPQHSPAKKTGRDVNKIDIVRKGELRHDLKSWSDGSVTEYWWDQRSRLVLYQDGADPHVLVAKMGNMDGSRFDESFFTWVAKDTFHGLKPFHGTTARYYELNVITAFGDKIPLRAWIDNKSSRPLAWSNGTMLDIFSFSPVPDGELTLPQNFQLMLTQMRSFFIAPKPPSPNGL